MSWLWMSSSRSGGRIYLTKHKTGSKILCSLFNISQLPKSICGIKEVRGNQISVSIPNIYFSYTVQFTIVYLDMSYPLCDCTSISLRHCVILFDFDFMFLFFFPSLSQSLLLHWHFK
uniref:Uncharacterized protein n=1 Tax=Gasterosteus aculeatus TaxID=69293 RepID=G3NDZ8_GASAC